MNILKKTAVLFLSGTMIFSGMGAAFAEENQPPQGQSPAAQNQELSIQWLDIDGSGLEINSYWRNESNYMTVPVEKFNDTGKSGSVIVNMQTGEVIGPLYYDYVGSVSEGLVEVSTYKTTPYEGGGYTVSDTKSGYIDLTGKEVIALQYERTSPFREGHAAVSKYLPVRSI